MEIWNVGLYMIYISAFINTSSTNGMKCIGIIVSVVTLLHRLSDTDRLVFAHKKWHKPDKVNSDGVSRARNFQIASSTFERCFLVIAISSCVN